MGKGRRLLLKHAIPTKIINRIKCAKQQFSETVTNLPVIKTFYTSSASDSVDNIASLNVTRTLVKCPLGNIEVDGVSLLEPVQSSSTEEEGVLPLDNSSVSMMNCETITSNENISQTTREASGTVVFIVGGIGPVSLFLLVIGMFMAALSFSVVYGADGCGESGTFIRR
ncbi:hypothetical protein ACI65C_004376 [Semiaphis heraclei]